MAAVPETSVLVQWPDGEVVRCYSPSSVVRVYFDAGEELTVAAWVERAGRALRHASERVRDEYGVPCGRALAQLDAIAEKARSFEADAIVRIVDVAGPPAEPADGP